jgi:hypothetical protein
MVVDESLAGVKLAAGLSVDEELDMIRFGYV